MSVVSVDRLGLRFGDRELWRDLTFDVEHGEFLAVLGPNGAGKTSLLRILLGQLEPTEGHVELDRTRIGYVPQQPAFDRDLPRRAGARHVAPPGPAAPGGGWRGPPPPTRGRIAAAVAGVGATALADAPVGRLSGGEQQRLRVAQALVSNPGLLLADEPLLSLDL